jgi:protein SCO1
VPPKPTLALLVLAAAAAVAALLLVFTAGPSRTARPRDEGSVQASADASTAGASGFDGAALPTGITAPAFTLADERGKPLALHQLRGQVTVLAFLFSRCGAACVLIAQQIRGALDELAKPPAVVIVSVDPAADTPASVARFLTSVSLMGRVHYLSGPPARLRAVWRAYRVVLPSSSAAAFERSATVALIDTQGAERVIFGQEQLTPEALAHDIGRLQAETPKSG